MHIPDRIFRAQADDIPGCRPEPSALEADRADRIVRIARTLICAHGREAISLRSIAVAARLSPRMLQRHFTDMEALIGEILTRHLQALAAALNRAPAGGAAKRAAYVTATRSGFGTFSAIHDLFIRHRGALPPDIAEPLDHFRRSLGITLAGSQGDVALTLLDTLSIDLPQIEFLLERLAEPPAATPTFTKAPTQIQEKPESSQTPASKPQGALEQHFEDTLFRTLESQLQEEKANVLRWRKHPRTGGFLATSARERALCTTAEARAGP